MRKFRRLTFALGLLAAAGCGSQMEDISDAELQEKVYECRSSSLSPGMAIACDNFRRECERRRSEGRFVC